MDKKTVKLEMLINTSIICLHNNTQDSVST